MDKYDLLEAMSGIRDRYIEEAATDLRSAGNLQDSDRPLPAENLHTAKEIQGAEDRNAGGTGGAGRETGRERLSAAGSSKPQKTFRRGGKLLRYQRWAATAAALLCLSILVPNLSPDAATAFGNIPLFGRYFRAVTFRSYRVQNENADAYVEEPGIVSMAAGDVQVEDEAGRADGDGTSGQKTLADGGALDDRTESLTAGSAEESASSTDMSDEPLMDVQGGTEAALARSSVRAAVSSAEITEEIRRKAEDQIESFENSLVAETGYHTLRFTHRTVTDSDAWFCLEVYAYTAAADGFEQVTHYNIDKKTGERVTLETWFGEDTEYVAPLSEEIIRQMRAQMEADPDIEYWLDSEEEPEYDFTEITPDQDCYFDSQGRLVICFNEGEAAPMYMGPVEFVIPESVTDSISRR